METGNTCKPFVQETFVKEIGKIVNPLVTSSAYGSFKFSIANDFLYRPGEKKEIVELKANVVSIYHNEIFINPLSDNDISVIKSRFSEEEVNEIFRPLSKIKANNTSYKVGYYDSEDFNKKFVTRIVNKQRKKLLTVKQITQEDIGELESSIIHKRSSASGGIHKTTIFKEQLKSLDYDIKTNQIEPSDFPPLILTEEIILNMSFNSNVGFSFSYYDFRIEHTDIAYDKALKGFYNTFYEKAKYLAHTAERNEEEQKDWEIVKKLIGNPDKLK